MNFGFKTRSFTSKPRQCVSKTRSFVLKMMNFAAADSPFRQALYDEGPRLTHEKARGVMGGWIGQGHGGDGANVQRGYLGARGNRGKEVISGGQGAHPSPTPAEMRGNYALQVAGDGGNDPYLACKVGPSNAGGPFGSRSRSRSAAKPKRVGPWSTEEDALLGELVTAYGLQDDGIDPTISGTTCYLLLAASQQVNLCQLAADLQIAVIGARTVESPPAGVDEPGCENDEMCIQKRGILC